ncbi:phosphonate C-P lyase system protein PhnH [Pectobacterium brasiliense]
MPETDRAGYQDTSHYLPRLPGSVRDYLCNRPHAFPTGLDFLFTSGKKLFAIPRSTHVEEC